MRSSSAAPTAPLPSAGPFLAVGMAGAVIVVDQLTKWWAESRLATGPCTPETCIDVVGSLRFHLSYNTGVSFGVADGKGFGWIIAVLATAVALWLFVVARRSAPKLAILLGVVAGGALGNVIDRVVRADDGVLSGGVVDFIDAQFFPIFNVADMAVVCGVISLILAPWLLGVDAGALLGDLPERDPDAEPDDAGDAPTGAATNPATSEVSEP